MPSQPSALLLGYAPDACCPLAQPSHRLHYGRSAMLNPSKDLSPAPIWNAGCWMPPCSVFWELQNVRGDNRELSACVPPPMASRPAPSAILAPRVRFRRSDRSGRAVAEPRPPHTAHTRALAVRPWVVTGARGRSEPRRGPALTHLTHGSAAVRRGPSNFAQDFATLWSAAAARGRVTSAAETSRRASALGGPANALAPKALRGTINPVQAGW